MLLNEVIFANVNSASSTINGPRHTFNFINNIIDAKLNKNEQFEVRCSSVRHFPEMVFRIADNEFVLAAGDYILKVR